MRINKLLILLLILINLPSCQKEKLLPILPSKTIISDSNVHVKRIKRIKSKDGISKRKQKRIKKKKIK